MAEAPRNQLPSGYDEDFVNAVEDEVICLICHLTLKEPVLTRCGHRFCKECLEEHFRSRLEIGEPSFCPADREGLDQEKDVFPDKATERKVLSFAIRCPSDGCEWTGELREKETHLTTCLFKVIPCTNENCQVAVQRKELEQHVTVTCQWRILKCDHCSEPHPECHMKDHIDQCRKFPVACPKSCGRSIPREMIPSHSEKYCPLTIISCPFVLMGCEIEVERQGVESHFQSATRIHLDLACDKLSDTEDKLDDTILELKETQSKLNKTESKSNDTERQLKDTTLKLKETQSKLNRTESKSNDIERQLNDTILKLKETQSKVNRIESKSNEIERQLKDTTLKLKETQSKLNRTESKSNDTERQLEDTIKTTKNILKELKQLQRNFSEKAIKDEPMKENMIVMMKRESRDFPSMFIWKIDNFSKRLTEAKAGEKTMVNSVPFYTENYGYKLSVEIYPNGYKYPSKNNHLSVYIAVMKGEYDALLPWP